MKLEYTEYSEENGKKTRLSIEKRLDLLEVDISALIIPATLMGPAEFVEYLHNLQKIGNIVRKLRQELTEKLDTFQQVRDRLQRSIGGASYLKNDTTGKPMAEVQRKALATVATAVWGPVTIMDRKRDADGVPFGPYFYVLAAGEQGIKSNIFEADRLTALQLKDCIAPGKSDDVIPSVEMSYDDLCRQGELLIKHLDAVDDELKTRHFACGHVAKMIEIENFEARRVSREGA